MRRTHVMAISFISVVSAAGLTHALSGPNTMPPALMAEATHGKSPDQASGHSAPHRSG